MPSSTHSSLRSSVRRGAARATEMQSLGLEDELSFGSDEDLMETIGEIEVPETELPPISSSSSRHTHSTKPKPQNKLRAGSSKSTTSLKASLKGSSSKRKETSLGSTTHLLPPLPPVPSGSTLDLPAEMFGERERPKRGSIMGAIKKKGLRRWRDDGSGNSFVTETSQASTISLHQVTSNATSASSKPSLASSMANTPSTQASAAAPHIAPLSLLSFDSGDHISLGRPSITESFDSKQSPSKKIEIECIPPSFTPTQLSLSRNTPATWKPSEISHAILPAFPATLAGLEPITVFTAQASKRPPSSILSNSTSSTRSPAKNVRWTPCTMVFTLFKVSLSGNDAAVASANGADEERTVAHVHVFSSQRPAMTPTSPTLRRSRSVAGFQYDPAAPRVEVERRTLSRDSTASVCESITDHDGRPLVLSIYFGNEDRTKAGNEWILEMKDVNQLHEWIRQIKKTAIMINAEELGYGSAIRPVYEDATTSADDLAHKLSVHARAVAAQKEPKEPKESKVSKESSTRQRFADKSSPPQSSTSLQDERRTSLEALQGIAMSRSRSADAADRTGSHTGSRTGSLGRSHRKSVMDVANPILTADVLAELADTKHMTNGHASDYHTEDEETELIAPFGGLTINGGASGLPFGSSLSFPAPPSALPPPRRPPPSTPHTPSTPREADIPSFVSPRTSPIVGTVRLASAASSPAMASTPMLFSGHTPAQPQSPTASPHSPTVSPRSPTTSLPFGSPSSGNDKSNSKSSSATPTPSMLATPTFGVATLASDDEAFVVCPPTPPRNGRSENATPVPPIVIPASPTSPPSPISPIAPLSPVLQLKNPSASVSAPSITSNTSQATSGSTSRLRRLRGKPQVIDVMAEFSSIEAEHLAPPPEEEPPVMREDRERRIRFA